MLNSVTLNNSKKVINWLSTEVSSEKIEPIDTSFALIMSNLANGRISLKFNNSVLEQKSSKHSTLIQR